MNRSRPDHSDDGLDRLSMMTADFTRHVCIEDLAFAIAEEGPDAVGLARMALWEVRQLEPDPVLTGTFGSRGDEEPEPEWEDTWTLDQDDPARPRIDRLARGVSMLETDPEAKLYDIDGKSIGRGWHGLAAVRSGERLVAVIAADNGAKGPAPDDQTESRLRLLAGAVGLVIDRMTVEAELDTTTEALEATSGSAGDPMMLVDTRGEVVFTNEAVRRWLQSLTKPLVGDAENKGEGAAPERLIRLTITSPTGQRRHHELRARPVKWRQRPAALLNLRDVTSQASRERALHEAVSTDRVTGLPDRRWFQQRLQSLVRRPNNGACDAVVAVDIDNFHKHNEDHGTAGGDLILAEVAERVAGRLRDNDEAARIGDDTIGVLLRNAGQVDQAMAVAQRIAERASGPVAVDGQEVDVTVSVGLCFAPRGSESADRMLAGADAALDQARDRGETVHLHRYETPGPAA
ncbi:MAG: sensor domain-containing diguanylate cyclase [Phycisphaeraceae bacterium]|nr:sensor domain-containing diguanylate cyclase [Phycisphaeraceae bacterium]